MANYADSNALGLLHLRDGGNLEAQGNPEYRQRVIDDAHAIYLGNLGTVEFDLTLPTKGHSGSTITWTSSDHHWMDDNGRVQQPEYGLGSRTIILTAHVAYDGASTDRDFEVTILQQRNDVSVSRIYPIALTAQIDSTFYLPTTIPVVTQDGDTVPQRVDWNGGIERRERAIGVSHYIGHIEDTDIPVEATAAIVAHKTETIEDSSTVVEPVALEYVRLTGTGLFASAQRRRLEFLSNVSIDDLLWNFRTAAGMDTREGKPMKGWDSPGSLLRGHTTGHMLSAFSLAWAATGDPRMRDKARELVDGLKEVQDAFAAQPQFHPGFLSAYSERQFDLLEQYTPYPAVWAPYYTLHKILAGLLDADQYLHDDTALAIARGIGDWTYERLHGLSRTQLQKMWSIYIGGEFGGINESLAELHRRTGEQRYLDAARRFDNDKLFWSMSHGIDALSTMHVNQHVPQAIGALRIYEETGLPMYRRVADFFWHAVTAHHIFSFGGIGKDEMFFRAGATAANLAVDSAETCPSGNMLKLSRELFRHDPDPAYARYYERVAYNHLAASVSHLPDGGSTYFLPTNHDAVKKYDVDGNTCCHGYGLELQFLYGSGACYHSERELLVNLYTSLSVDDPGHGVAFTIESSDDDPGRVRLRIATSGGRDLALIIPEWAVGTPGVSVDGHALPADQVTSLIQRGYIRLGAQLRSAWGFDSWDGHEVDLEFACEPFWIRAEDRPELASLAWGPYVYGAVSDSAEELSIPVHDDMSDDFRKVDGTKDLLHAGTGIVFRPLAEIDREHYQAYVHVIAA